MLASLSASSEFIHDLTSTLIAFHATMAELASPSSAACASQRLRRRPPLRPRFRLLDFDQDGALNPSSELPVATEPTLALFDFRRSWRTGGGWRGGTEV